MNQHTTLQELYARTYHLHRTEDGIWDILVGFFLVFFGAFWPTNSGIVGVCGALGPLISQRLRTRYVYPRIGYASFAESETKKRRIMYVMIAVVTLLLTAIFSTIKHFSAPDYTTHPLLGSLSMMVTGIVILGGIMGVTKFYLYALALFVPIMITQYLKNPSTGMFHVFFFVFSLLFILSWREHKVREQEMALRTHSDRVLHYSIALAGVMMFDYYLFRTYRPEIADWVIHMLGAHKNMVIVYGIAVFILILGLANRIPRFMLYALLLCVVTFPFFTVPCSGVTMWDIVAYTGLLIILLGVMQLVVFIRKHPIQHEENDTHERTV